ncbi:MAG: hypothetical protein MZV65_13145 [Chromatiales bacterium]|nr:hypothetical protein [Chromatiales bacterium]
MTDDIRMLMRWASLVLTLPVVLYSARPFFRSAWRDLKRSALGMDVPVALGVGTAFVGQRLRHLHRPRRGVLRLGRHVRLLPAHRTLPRNERRAARAARGARNWSSSSLPPPPRLPNWPARDEERVPVARARRPATTCWCGPARRLPADGVVVEGDERGERGHAHRRIAAGVERRVRREGDRRQPQPGEPAR